MENRYQGVDLYVPTEAHEHFARWVGGKADEAKPFPRQIDFWWAGVCLGLRMGAATPLPEKMIKFNTGGILSSDPWRLTHLELIALAIGGEELLENPHDVIRRVSEYAMTGMLWMTKRLVGEAEPTLSLMNSVAELEQL